MARHSQRGGKTKQPPFVCTHCKAHHCNDCVDIVRIAYDLGSICKCTRKLHSGEPVNQQVRDPFDGSVHGPELIVSEDGQVSYLDYTDSDVVPGGEPRE